jgi:hypothetical protein
MTQRIHHVVPLALWMAIGLAGLGCGSSNDGAADVPDTQTDTVTDDGPGDVLDVADVPVIVDAPDVVDLDTLPGDVSTDVPATRQRTFSFRALCGMSMGAAAMTVATHSITRGGPDFDVIGAMGGYIDYRYMSHAFRDLLMGGFPKMSDILDHIDTINDPVASGLECGPVAGTQPYEWAWSFNQLHYNNNGGAWKRQFYLDAIGSFSYAFGNMMSYNPDNPLLPPGVPYEWMRDTSRGEMCAHPYVIPKKSKDAYNAEYNPNGDYDLVTVCDGDTPVGCKDDDPNLCGTSNPDYRQLASWFDPSQPHNLPYPFLLAVDYNGNGKRDYAEPIVVNAIERFSDVGLDGCPNALEDGLGGCLAAARANPVGDPNGDDFDLQTRPLGTEGNFEYDAETGTGRHESYEDFGLDGVAGTLDYGEGDDQYSMSPGMKALIDQDVRTFIMNATDEQLRNHTWYFDGGIRDALHSLTSNMHITARLEERGQGVRIYDDFARTSTAVVPNSDLNELALDLSGVDFSPAHFGRNAMVRYGDPNAALSDILAGDGGHVGAGAEIVLRATMFFGLAFNRMPDVFVSQDFSGGAAVWSSHYSEALKGRRWFVLAVPPGYDDPANKDRKYPLGIMLPGIGMPLNDMSATMAVFDLLQSNGRIPHFITLLPDGQCALVRTSDGKRMPGCVEGPNGGIDCVDDECKGPHETCTVTHFDNDAGMRQECNSGHFFVNHKTNIWGDPGKASEMKYEDSLFEVITHVNQNYRAKESGTYEVPADW